jgi:DNA topoisomerase-2
VHEVVNPRWEVYVTASPCGFQQASFVNSIATTKTWKNNMGVAGKASINSSKSDYTKVTFKPDLSKFMMTHLDRDTVGLMTRRAYDIAGCTKGVAVYLNGKKLPVKTFRDYVELYVKGQPVEEEEEDLPRKIVHEVVNPRWEVCVTASPCGFQQASFVNSIATTKVSRNTYTYMHMHIHAHYSPQHIRVRAHAQAICYTCSILTSE